MSAALPARTRDGGFSVAAQIQAMEEEPARLRIDVAGAKAWAEANGVHEENGRLEVGRINARRAELGLPLFLVTRALPPVHMEQEVQHRGGRPAKSPEAVPPAVAAPTPSAAPPPSGPTAPSAPPICHSDDELLRLVTEEDGTITGTVTPEIAGWLLALNTGNRQLQRKGVERFIDILKTGTWMNTGEPVIVSRQGVLNDGQHRLSAVAQSGIAAVMDVRFGIERMAFPATGTGARRSAGQVLTIAGQRFASAQASIARLLHFYDTGQMARISRNVEPAEIVRIVEENPQVTEVAGIIQKHRFAPARTAPFGLILAVALRVAPPDRVMDFAGMVNTGITEREDCPARQLHLRFRDVLGRRERLPQVVVAALTARAWNAWIAGRHLHRITMLDADRTNEGFPKVIGA